MKKHRRRSSRLAYSIPRLAAMSDCGRSSLYDEIAHGRLIASKVGRRTIVTRKNALRWLAALPTLSPKQDADNKQ